MPTLSLVRRRTHTSNNVSTPCRGSHFVVDPHSSSPPGGGSASNQGRGDSLLPSNESSGGSSAGRSTRFPNKLYKKGRRLRFGDKPPPVGMILKHWTDCKDELIADVDDVSDTLWSFNFLVTTITQLISMQTRYGFTSRVLAPEPKNQREARRRADFRVNDWIEAEWIEMDTVYNMGTIQFVPTSDLPFGTTLILTKFAYKCKFGDKGQVIKKKVRIVVRGDLQHESEYTETFTPTSRFNALRMLMSIAVQQSYKLVNFDVKG
eukprot:1855426-Rhodomonas_salina.3